MNKDFKQVVDDRLSGVRMSHELQMNILNKTREEGEIIVKKKISAGLILAIAGVLAATVVLAAGLLFSPRYDASKLANEAMLNKYGITDKLMSVFQREAVQNTNGSLTITYAPAEGVFRYGENYLGVYTVTVENGKAEAVWSHDGENTSGGLDAKAWGAEQVELLVTDYGKVMKILLDRAGTPPAKDIQPVATPTISMEEYEKLKLETKKKVENAAKITLTKAKENAVLALTSECGLSKTQLDLLAIFDGDEVYQFENGSPMVSLAYHLMQGNEWLEKDGIYTVKINLENGEIEDIFYDSGLAANG